MSLNGPRLDARAGKAQQLVVFLHGYGADGNDLLGIGREWQKMMPETAFVAPHAPQRCGMGGSGFQWFPLTFQDPHERWKGVQAARPLLDAFLDEELARLELDESRLALVGFSQGTMLALHAGLRRRRRLAAIVGYSGTLEGGSTLETEVKDACPILLVHGESDEVVPVDALFDALDSLSKAGLPAQWHLSPGLGHGIDQGGLTHGLLFLTQAFGIKVPA